MRNKITASIYWIVGLIHLFTVYRHGEFPEMELYSKAALMPILLFTCFSLKNRAVRNVGIPVILALFFSWIGDLVLTNEEFFLYGLGAFFLAHAFYIFSFTKSNFDNHEVALIHKAPIFMLLFVFFGGMMFFYLKPNLGEMILPVIAYIGIIIGMNIAALNRYKKVNDLSFWLIMIGAIFFLISDSIIAINKFDHLIDNASVYIMFTYILAQFLIVQGTLKRIDEV